MRSFYIVLLSVVLLILGSLVFFPQIDQIVSGLFYAPESGFFWKDNAILLGFKYVAFDGSRILAACLLIAGLVTLVRKNKFFGLKSKAWFFLLCCLLIGPGIFANVVFKEHWGRARPRDVEMFGGSKTFSPAAYITDQCDTNCSFVSGDASFGFFLTAFAFIVAPRRQRLIFWSGLGVGSLFAIARVFLGAHFLSDILFALVLILATNASLYAAFYGRQEASEAVNRMLRNRI